MSKTLEELIPDISVLRQELARVDYLAEAGLATAIFCAIRLGQPLLLEGEPGVGKTEAAKSLAKVLTTPLLRLQCYEGIDATEAIYEWNYPKQLLGIRMAEATGKDISSQDLFDPSYLIERPLLRALRHEGPRPAVLLVDEVDRSDDEFEAFLLEILGEKTITIPELGTVHPSQAPIVILTSNRTRDLHDALKRRCIYHFIDYPSVDTTVEILHRRVHSSTRTLLEQAARAVAKVRELNHLQKLPGLAETINWVEALQLLGYEELNSESFGSALGSLLKYKEDHAEVELAFTGHRFEPPPS